MRTLTLALSHKWERGILIIVLILAGTAHCVVPAYGLQLSESEYLEGFNSKEETEISKEKENIIESIAPAREEREKNLHPFVQPVVVGEGLKPSPTTENVRLREPPYRPIPQGYGAGGSRSRIEVSNPEPKRGINFLFILIILAAFLLAHFFIKSKSK